MFHITANIEAIYDVLFVGDHFLKDAFTKFMRQKAILAMSSKKPEVAPYILEYYNVFTQFNGAGVKTAVGRLVNSLIEGLNK